MGNKPNWGAGLQSLGQSLGQMYERRLQQQEAEAARLRQEKTMAMLRQQSLDDREALWGRQDDQNAALYGPRVPAPVVGGIDFNAPGIGAESTGAGIAPENDYNYLGVNLPRDEFQGQYASKALDSWTKLHPVDRTPENLVTVTDPQGRAYKVPPATAYNINNPKAEDPKDPTMAFTYPSAEWVDPALRGKTVLVPPAQYTSLTNEFYGRYGGGGKIPDANDVTAGWYGGEKQSGDFNQKTGAVTPFSYPFRGSVYDQGSSPLDLIPDLENEVKNLQAAGQTISTEQQAREVLGRVQSRYNLPLAQQLEQELGAAFKGWEDNTKGGAKVPGEYRKARGPWGFDKTFDWAKPATDWVVPDDIKVGAEFYADLINPLLANNDTQDPQEVKIEIATINKWLGKRGMTLAELSGYLKTSGARGVNLPEAGKDIVRQRQSPTASKQAPAGAEFDEETGKFWVEDGSGNWVVAE